MVAHFVKPLARFQLVAICAGLLCLLAAPAAAAPKLDAPAPQFIARTTTGDTISLSDFSGRKVIFEWTNHQCAYVRKHYETGNMQQLQRDMADQGVVWVTVISSAPGDRGYVDAEQANALTIGRGAAPAHVVLDESGEIRRLFGAETTPQMYVVDERAILRYAGAIDDNRSASRAAVSDAQNYVRLAVDSIWTGEEVVEKSTQSYGCRVRYAGS